MHVPYVYELTSVAPSGCRNRDSSAATKSSSVAVSLPLPVPLTLDSDSNFLTVPPTTVAVLCSPTMDANPSPKRWAVRADFIRDTFVVFEVTLTYWSLSMNPVNRPNNTDSSTKQNVYNLVHIEGHVCPTMALSSIPVLRAPRKGFSRSSLCKQEANLAMITANVIMQQTKVQKQNRMNNLWFPIPTQLFTQGQLIEIRRRKRWGKWRDYGSQ